MTLRVATRATVPHRGPATRPATPPPATDLNRGLRMLERHSAFAQLGLVLQELAARYTELPANVIRQEAVDVLCLGAPDRLTPALVGRLVEARLLALL